MSDSALTIARDGSVVTLTLTRPDDGNPITSDVAQELAAAWRAVHDDESVLAVILTGGPTFSVGEPEQEPPGLDRPTSDLIERPLRDAVEGLAALRCPVIAAIGGRCEGMGLELALACDLRVCSEDATFAMQQVARGGMPRWGGTQRLPRTIPRGAALEMVLLGEPMRVAEAYRIGLVNKVVPAADLMATAQAWAATIAAKAPIATRYAREAIMRGLDMTLPDGSRLEGDLYFLLQTTEDRSEGVRAFLERRPPVFRGR